MRPTSLFLLACLNVACISASAGTSGCAATVQELARMTGEPAFPLKWTETTMGDGKPLVVSISERQGVLALEFTKTREASGLKAPGSSARPAPIWKSGFPESRFAWGRRQTGSCANRWVKGGPSGYQDWQRTGSGSQRWAGTVTSCR